ncbi:protein SCAI-like [Xenia sp. Carnegie-2017]|uniref:protein SCAI-like n=1 Tax=Xenia sp. Carnegie-2017 TaxID=2897299 RepID=UPI001F04EAA4|nr:protein SCAI-like [Xenia sp. Carnegie-2017]
MATTEIQAKLSESTKKHDEIRDCKLMESDSTTNESNVVTEFCNLLEESRQLFQSLRDIPQFGHKNWQAQFGKTFATYSKLWKFQQENRSVLDKRYNLKRWQIGEIASKIGQLYYHYYLRTSESSYLQEAFSFYMAIRSRAYYTNASKFGTSDLMVKKLRYYARFVVVSLLLNKMNFVKELVEELKQYIDEYTTIYDPTDEEDWRLVVSEVTSFIDSASIVTVMNGDMTARTLCHRLHSEENQTYCFNEWRLHALQEIIIVSNKEKQIKFNELTLDMFRMLQVLEREPEEIQGSSLENSSDFNKRMKSEPAASKRANPHKYLFYKPTFTQLYTFLASGFKELPHNAVMLIYISADGCRPEKMKKDDGPYRDGGVKMSTHKPAHDDTVLNKKNNLNEINAVYPDDLMPFTRKAMLLIVDSETSTSFKRLSSMFGQPFVTLMSPCKIPVTLNDTSRNGNLFTLFLHNPMVAFLYVCNINIVQGDLWDQCCLKFKVFEGEWMKLFKKLSKAIDISFNQLIEDEFLSLMIRRFAFSYYVMRQHKAFKGEEYYPSCSPYLPSTLMENDELRLRILTLASLVDVRAIFYELDDVSTTNS